MNIRNPHRDFFAKVYEITRLVPPGRVTTYGAIARYIGSPQSARMVGWALNKAFTQSPFVPAHRVVNRNGLLTGKRYFGGAEAMKEMLAAEGIPIENDRITNFDKYFWDPYAELV